MMVLVIVTGENVTINVWDCLISFCETNLGSCVEFIGPNIELNSMAYYVILSATDFGPIFVNQELH